MKKKLVTILTIFMMLFCILSMNNYVFADTQSWVDLFSGDDIDPESEVYINNLLGIILGVIQIVAMGIAIIMLTYLGIKYMSAAPSERANIKNHMITFTLGAVLVFGAAKILELLTNISQDAFN